MGSWMRVVYLLLIVAAAAGLVAVLALDFGTPETPAPQATASLAAVEAAIRDRDWERAAAVAEAVLEEHPDDPEVLLAAGEAAARLGRFGDAIRRYDAVPDSAGADAAVARLCSGDARLKLGRMTEAERDFRRALELDPSQTLAQGRLVVVLMVSGRRWEAGPHLLELVRRNEARFDDLCSLGDPVRLVTNDDQLTRSRQLAPDDPLPILGMAATAQLREETGRAEGLLESITEDHPQLIEAQVRFGEVLARRGDTGRFLSWHSQLPSGAEQHPQLWHVRGLFAAERGETETAARCFWEALRREPNHLGATYQLGPVLASLGRPQEARRLGERARKLQRVTSLIQQLHERPDQIEVSHETFGLLRDLGRLWEARAWLQAALIVDRNADWIAGEQAFFASSATWEPQQTASGAAPASWLDCSSYPLPEWAKAGSIVRQEPAPPGEPAAIRFELADVGIDFRYFSSPDDSTPGVRMQEFTGGGVAAIDFDGDGRPDLYFTQGCQWPPDLRQRTHLDRIYRNLGERFVDVTHSAGIVEAGFSQGVACGDLDADGFQDLYVANIGGNRLFRNNGDGTFTDATDSSGILAGEMAEAWTVSAAFADLNGDALPDLFDVNYVQGENVYELVCGQGAEQRACSPSSFEGQPDRLLLNRGDGTFVEVTSIAGIDGPDGTGLGILVADFGSGRPGIFVANDIQNNHFYENEAPPGTVPKFREQALLNGTAYDRGGRPQACMGVAAGDADGDGRLDLFITNYVDESNTLYRQELDGLFADASRAAGLTEPSFKMLGFGTQFLDADLDGREDLVLTNGHIDDFLHEGYEYRMRPQVFRNLGGRFEEVHAESLGTFFEQKWLGRGLARIDWNGDGREEFAVSHLDDPASLLTNVSAGGKSLSLKLVATTTGRDSIGTIVTVDVQGRQQMRQLTAGDGYAASNERKLVFGIGEADAVDSVTVRWPSGAVDVLPPLPAGTQWLIIEGRARPLSVGSHAMGAAPPRALTLAEPSAGGTETNDLTRNRK